MSVARPSRQEQQLRQILDAVPGNDRCADCEASTPRWASTNLGVFLCTRCAGLHRKMGTHISQVKSISLDQWTQEQVERMQATGNTIANYNYNPLRNWPVQDDDLTMERFIRDKYERKAFSSQRETANFTPIKSALKGGSKTMAPPASQEDADRFRQELQTLGEMGFADRNRNIGVLKSVMGDVASATDVLVAMESTDGKEPPAKPQRPRVRFTEDTIGGLETPQLQVGNPFAAWTGGSQVDINPFSSIPPSMYKQPMPDVSQHGFTAGENIFPPAAPLRQQLTGGQPLRPQLQQQQPQQNFQERQQLQPTMQPLRAQLTGLPTPQQLSDAQTQAYTYTGHHFAPTQVQPQQQPQPFSSGQGFLDSFVPDRPASAQPGPSFGIQQQSTGSSNAYRPQVAVPPPPPPRQQQQQQQQQQQPFQQAPPPPQQQPNNFFTPLVPQKTAQQQQQYAYNQAGSAPHNVFGQGSLAPQQQQGQQGVSPQATGPFGQSFTQPLQAQLTGIQNSLSASSQQQQPSLAYGQQNMPLNGLQQQSTSAFQVSPQVSGMQRSTGGYQISPQMSGFSAQQQQPANGHTQQPGLFSTGPSQPPQQHLGMQQTGSQPFQQMGNGGNSLGLSGLQARVSSPFAQQPGQPQPPQQHQQPGGFNPMQPFKTFDKASIMSLYNTGNQPQQQQQFQPQQPSMQGMRPMMTGPQQPFQQQQQQPQQAFGAFSNNMQPQAHPGFTQQQQQQQQQRFPNTQGTGGGDWYS